MDNPYTTLFGKVPAQMIPRSQQAALVTDSFLAKSPSQQVYVVTGVRGSGKTVFMTDVSRRLARDSRWAIEELSIEQDLLVGLVARLSNQNSLSRLFLEAKIDLSFFGLGVHVRGAQPITDIGVALERMLRVLKRANRRLLVTIDEVVNNAHMRSFASAFQILVRKDLPVFLLMTGLYENIENLQNEKTLTFLYRAPKIRLEPLGIRSIAANYAREFGIDRERAVKMAHRTNGYSFAFQLLGYLVWERKGLTEQTLEEYKAQLFELSYDKIWNELSPGDRRIAYGIACAASPKVQDIRAFLGLESNQLSPYRRRLINKGVVDGTQRGRMSFTLPCFDEYVLERYGEDEALI